MRCFRFAAARLAISPLSCSDDITTSPCRRRLRGGPPGYAITWAQPVDLNVAYSRFVARCLQVMMPGDGRGYSGSVWAETPQAEEAARVDASLPGRATRPRSQLFGRHRTWRAKRFHHQRGNNRQRLRAIGLKTVDQNLDLGVGDCSPPRYKGMPWQVSPSRNQCCDDLPGTAYAGCKLAVLPQARIRESSHCSMRLAPWLSSKPAP